MFTLKLVPEVRCRVAWYKLLRKGHCFWDEFCEQIRSEGNLKNQIASAVAIMERYGNRDHLMQNKLKNISEAGDPFNLFEIKTRDLRIYFLRDANGAVIVLGGKKSTQRSDIKQFRNIAREYSQQKL